jgi:hypothetical protein
VELTNAADVEIIKDSVYKVEVMDFGNIIGFLKTTVTGNKLTITTTSNTVISNSKAKVIVHMPDALKSIIVDGSGDMLVKSSFTAVQSIKVSGSGDFKAEQNCNSNTLSVSNSGSGDIEFKGTASNTTIDNSGSGSSNLLNTTTKDATTNCSGSGNISISVTDNLNARISGSGDTRYMGNPVIIKSITGSGQLIKL